MTALLAACASCGAGTSSAVPRTLADWGTSAACTLGGWALHYFMGQLVQSTVGAIAATAVQQLSHRCFGSETCQPSHDQSGTDPPDTTQQNDLSSIPLEILQDEYAKRISLNNSSEESEKCGTPYHTQDLGSSTCAGDVHRNSSEPSDSAPTSQPDINPVTHDIAKEVAPWTLISSLDHVDTASNASDFIQCASGTSRGGRIR